MTMDIHDVEKIQELYPDHQIELRGGKIIIQAPADGVSAEIGARIGMLLGT